MTTQTLSQKQASPPEKPAKGLSLAWLQPYFVVVTAIALALGTVGGRAEWSGGVMGVIAVTAYIAGGLFGAKTAIISLVKERKIDVDMLMVLAAIGAASIGQWLEGALLLFLFSLSNVLQDYAIGRSRQAIQSLFKLYPETAQVRRRDAVINIPFSDIQLEDVLLVKPGERIAVDGVVLSGQSAIDESPITGESLPVDKGVGDIVFAGTLNKQGILDIQPTKTAKQTTLARIIQMVEEAQDTKAPTERFLDRFEQIYATLIILATGLLITLPPLLLGANFQDNFYLAMVFMTVASPCALIISVPSAYISAIASSARMGVLLKGGAYLEHLATLKAIAFDKTGTLTIGKPTVTDMIPLDVSETELLSIAGSVEARSEHPLARAIVAKAKEVGATMGDIEGFEALVGRGIQATYAGATILLGSVSYLISVTPLPETLSEAFETFSSQGKTTMGVLRNGQWVGLLALSDPLRSTSKALIQQLSDIGVSVAMFTGDNERVAKTIADQLGIKRFKASLMPEDKVTAIQELIKEFGSVGMVGDGINDAPALATATVGIAMGGAGSDVAMETADVVLMGDSIDRIVNAIALAKRTRRVVWQNITFALLVIMFLVAGAFLIQLPLPVGVLAHEGSTVIVVLNSLIQLLLLPEWVRSSR